MIHHDNAQPQRRLVSPRPRAPLLQSLVHRHDQIRYMDKAGNIIFVDKMADVPDQYKEQVIRPTPTPVLTKKDINDIKKQQREQEAEIKRKELDREKAKKKHDQEQARAREKQEKELKKSDPTRQLEKVGRR